MTIRGFIDPKILEQAVYDKLKNRGITKYDYPINPFELIQKEGIVLQETSFDDDNIRGMIVHGPNKSGIIINANRSFESRRFIAMHELSHYWFHPRETKTICFEKYKEEKRGIEWQANNATAFALMPREIVTDLFDHFNGDICFISDYLKVSTESLSYRLKELGLKKNNTYYTENFNYYYDQELVVAENQWLYGGL